MFRTQKQIVVNAPADRVFNYLADLTRHGEWGGKGWLAVGAGLRDVTETSPGPVGVGSTYERRVTRKSYGVDHYGMGTEGQSTSVNRLSVTEFVPNQRIAFERKMHFENDLLVFQVESANGGTRLTMQAEENILWWMWLFLWVFLPVWPIVWPIAKLSMSRTLGQYLRRIKERLDS